MMMAYLARRRMEDSKGQTVPEHLLHVGEVMAGFAAGIGFSQMARLIGLLHDLGKCTEEFAAYLDWCRANPGDNSRRGTVDHTTAGGQLLRRRYGAHSEDGRLAADLASLVIFSHHAGLLNYVDKEGKADFERRMEKDGVLACVDLAYYHREVIEEAALDRLFEEAVGEFSALDKRIGRCFPVESEMYYFSWGMVHKLLFSMLVDADRLDSAEFELDARLIRQWQTEKLWEEFSVRLEEKVEGFPVPEEEMARKVAGLRRQISDDCLGAAQNAPGIYNLSVPTGGGKTLAGMRFALRHAELHGKKRIVVVIPYTSIIEQNAKEIRDVFDRDEAVLEHHSAVLAEDGEGGECEGADWRRLLTERWDAPVIFTTQVQFLNALFAGGAGSMRRLHALEDSVLIFDEIQTLPVRCTHLFNAAMNFLQGFCRVTAVLCTATQPPLEALDCSLALGVQAELTRDAPAVFEEFRRVRIEDCCRDGGVSVDELAADILQSAEERGDVLAIVNLTRQARELYQAVSALAWSSGRGMRVVHLSTKMCPAHRRRVLDGVRRELEHRREKPEERLICISTQLIEAGVDVSFPVVYRALAGFSSIAQAAGRCNRHGGARQGLVRIVELASEGLLHLEDIREGKKIARILLHKHEADDILSPEVMKEYFLKFYLGRTPKELRYSLEKRYTLFDLLSGNCAGQQARREKGEPDFWFMQAFGDAGRAFAVIDSYTESVLVPYGEGKELAAAFDGWAADRKRFRASMRRAQPYMVNLFRHELETLESQGAVRQTQSGVFVLCEMYYREDLGVQLEQETMDYMI